MIRINPFFLRQRSYPFQSEVLSLPFFFSYVFPCPLETPKNGQIPFLRNTYSIRHSKKDNGNPIINHFIYEFHSNRNTCSTVCNLLSSCLAGKVRGKDDSFHSDRHESPTTLHCQNPCCICIKERGLLQGFSHRTILFPTSPPSPRSTERKCRAGANSSSRKKGLTEPGSLTNTNLIEKNCLFCILSPVLLLPRAWRNRSDHIGIPSTQHRSSFWSRRPTKRVESK